MARRGFTVPSSSVLKQSIGSRLAPTVDRLRDLATRFGLRAYRVRIVVTRSTGPRRGQGPEMVVSEVELLPTPLVETGGLTGELVAAGMIEQGSVTLRHVSGRYTEDLVNGLGRGGIPLAPNESMYYEIESVTRDGSPGKRQRYQLAAPATQNSLGEWTISLTGAIDGRARDGRP